MDNGQVNYINASKINPYILDVTALSTKLNHKKITMILQLSTVYGGTSIGIEV